MSKYTATNLTWECVDLFALDAVLTRIYILVHRQIKKNDLLDELINFIPIQSRVSDILDHQHRSNSCNQRWTIIL